MYLLCDIYNGSDIGNLDYLMNREFSQLTKELTRTVNIPCTVDLRKYAEGKAGIANLTGTYNFNIKEKAEWILDTIVREIEVFSW